MKAICRVAKIKGSGSITGKSEHNYRQGYVPNADPQRKHLNHEYVLNYENLGKAIEARIEHAGIQKVRQDAVKGMEFILTASPEHFKRDQGGQVIEDYCGSDWVKANLEFMRYQYGSNLVAFTLHQDEKTPHIHAIVVPITPDNRLCAKELFTPKTLRQLQTDYAQATQPFGLERGIRGSRAKHVEMKHIYGLQQQERKAIEQELAPIQQAHQPLQIQSPGILDLLNLERWKQEQEAKINAEYSRRLTEVQKAAQKAQNAAIANAIAKEHGKVLQQRLESSERLKQANHGKARQAGQQLAGANQLIEKVAVLVDENRLNPKWSQQKAQQARERVLPQMEDDLLACIGQLKAGSVEQASEQLLESLKVKGYEINTSKGLLVVEPKSSIQLDLTTAQFNGRNVGQLVNQRLEDLQQQELKQNQKEQLEAKHQQRNRGPRLGR